MTFTRNDGDNFILGRFFVRFSCWDCGFLGIFIRGYFHDRRDKIGPWIPGFCSNLGNMLCTLDFIGNGYLRKSKTDSVETALSSDVSTESVLPSYRTFRNEVECMSK